jgi:plasmid stabilization system protein ParE
MARVIRSDRADLDLFGILIDVAVHRGQRASDRLSVAIERKGRQYARLPLIGILRDDPITVLRYFPMWGYLVFYRPAVDDDGIEIARILHGSQNITPDLFT